MDELILAASLFLVALVLASAYAAVQAILHPHYIIIVGKDRSVRLVTIAEGSGSTLRGITAGIVVERSGGTKIVSIGWSSSALAK